MRRGEMNVGRSFSQRPFRGASSFLFLNPGVSPRAIFVFPLRGKEPALSRMQQDENSRVRLDERLPDGQDKHSRILHDKRLPDAAG